MKKILRSLLLVTAGSLLGAVALIGYDAVKTIDPVDAQVTPIDEEPDDAPGLGSIVGSPEAGPAPEDAGDRGGYAQLALAAIMLGAVLFIASRIVFAARRNNTHDEPL